MATILTTIGGDLNATTITATTQFSGSGAGLTSIPASTALSGQVAAANGGTGVDSSAFTGVAKVASGTWSAATVVDADVSASAAITRSKLANGTASHVVINDGSGVLSSEAQLAPVRGGTGADLTSGSAGIAHITATTGVISNSLIVNADVDAAAAIVDTKLDTISTSGKVANSATTATTASTASTIVLRDSNGNIPLSTSTVTTTDATATNIYTVTSATDVAYTIDAFLAIYDTTNDITGSIKAVFKAKNIAGTVTTDGPASKVVILDSGLENIDISITESGTTIQVQVTGLAATSIKWNGEFKTISQTKA